MRRGLLYTVAAWAALTATGAQAQAIGAQAAKQCLSHDEAEAAMLMMAPGALRGLRSVCEPKLGPTSYLKTSGDKLAARISAAQKETEVAADAAIAKMMGIKPGKGVKSASAMFDPIAEMMIAGSEDKLDAKTCDKIDQVLFLLDPLPVRNLSGLFVLAGAMANKKDKDPTFTICEAD